MDTITELERGDDVPEPKKWWWVAINGASLAASPMPLAEPVVEPCPEELLGFATQDEQLQTQEFLLEAPIEHVSKFIRRGMIPRSRAGKTQYRRLDHPQPPIQGSTNWMDAINNNKEENQGQDAGQPSAWFQQERR